MIALAALPDWPEYVEIFVGIFALVSPPIVVPLYLGLVAGRSGPDKARIALIGSVGFWIAAACFNLVGEGLLGVFGISIPAFQVAGGFLLLLIALDLLRSPSTPDAAPSADAAASLMAIGAVPLAIPILAGPGTLSAVVLFATEYDSWLHRAIMLPVLAAIAVLIYATLRIAGSSERLFTPNATTILSKVMGLITAAIAFDFMLSGIGGFFPQLETIG